MKNKKLLCLGIESSCDETSAAIVSTEREILSHIIYSQIPQHQKYGGVVPELAARAHVLAIDEVVQKTLSDAGKTISDIDIIAATAGPGLIGGVLIGWEFAVGLTQATGKPLVAVNHLEGHALVPRLTNNIPFPYLLMLASGGHSQILLARCIGDYEIIGQTLDDSAGEAFDKVSKMLGLGYPGGQIVDDRSKFGDKNAFKFPRPLCDKPGCDFSFSGIKTAVRTQIINNEIKFPSCGGVAQSDGVVRELENKIFNHPTPVGGTPPQEGNFINNVCASFQSAVVDCIINRLQNALNDSRVIDATPKTMVVAGGVAKNSGIRLAMEKLAHDEGMKFAAPPLNLCTDNGAMIAWAGIENYLNGRIVREPIAPRPRWPLTDL